MRNTPLVVAILLAPAVLGQDEDEYGKALERYEECQRRTPFVMHARGWTALAKVRDERSLPIFAADYASPRPPTKEFGRYLVAAIATRYLTRPHYVPALDAWRLAHTDPEDAWLWMRTLTISSKWDDGEAAAKVARESDSIFLRAAAIEALAIERRTALFDVVPEIALAMPEEPGERALLVGALADALLELKSRSSTKEYRRMAVPVIRLLDDEELPFGAKLALVRHLSLALGEESLVMESQPWVDLLAGKKRASGSDEHGYVKPTFFGVEGSGKRIVYVIDASDSMCKKIEGKPKGPESGPKRKRKKGELPTEADIPWQRVETRFDLAREHLRISLQRLSEDQSFCVVLFGDRARTLSSTKGLMEAKESRVKKALQELDRITAGEPEKFRPDGTLKGKTNLHGGLRLAFGAVEKKVVDEGAYVDPLTFVEGADTIFVLSDGDPTWDDWDKLTTNYFEDEAGDPESRISMAQQPEMHYAGPYREWDHLLEDVKRMNLFREVELHCVAIGEVQMVFVEELAKIGMGKAVRVGGQ